MRSASCHVGEVESCLEGQLPELGLQHSPSGPQEPLSHVVKEESDTEPELGGTGISVGCGTLLGTVFSRPKSDL